MILVDTSAWVEYDRATGSAVDLRVAQLIGDGGTLLVTEPVMMEVLAGAGSDARERELRRLLLSFGSLRFDPIADFDAAARIYHRCRRAGVTPRGMLDLMIVAVAYRCGASLLAWDVDIDRVARVVGLQLDASPRRA